MHPLVPALSLLCLSAWPAAAAQERTPAPPRGLNVVLILADDLGSGDVGCYGGTIPTPHLDALAAGGTRFTQAYVTAPTCGPSRAGLLTGRYQQRCGFEFNVGRPNVKARRERGIPADVPLLPERMRALGLTTGMVGKWHLGFREDAHPLERGFEQFFGFLGGSSSYLPGPRGPSLDPLLRGREPVPEEPEYLTDAFAREATAFIRAHAEERFFLYAAFNAPHRPHEATEEYLARFPELEGTARVYAAMVSALDDAVGRILAALEEADIAERTLVVFASDNGAVAVDGAGSNGPLRLGKFTLFEGGVRVPMIVRDPRAAGGRVVDTPVSALDLFPTLLAAAGGDTAGWGPLDGRDLAGTLRGEPAATKPEAALFWRVGSCSALRLGDLKLVRSGASDWLFDLADDPGEQLDLTTERPQPLGELAARLERWGAALGSPLWSGAELERAPVVCGKAYRTEY
jgi:arylsulfatase A-like enzyme